MSWYDYAFIGIGLFIAAIALLDAEASMRGAVAAYLQGKIGWATSAEMNQLFGHRVYRHLNHLADLGFVATQLVAGDASHDVLYSWKTK